MYVLGSSHSTSSSLEIPVELDEVENIVKSLGIKFTANLSKLYTARGRRPPSYPHPAVDTHRGGRPLRKSWLCCCCCDVVIVVVVVVVVFVVVVVVFVVVVVVVVVVFVVVVVGVVAVVVLGFVDCFDVTFAPLY